MTGGPGERVLPGAGKRALIRAEVRYLARALGQGGTWGFGVVFALALLFGLKVLLFDQQEPGNRGLFFAVVVGYAIYSGILAGLLGAVGTLLWRTVRTWILVPVIVVPVTLLLSAWAFRWLLDAQLGDVFAAMGRVAKERDMMIDGIGHAAHAGPIVLVIFLPLLMIDLGAILLHPSVLWQVCILAVDVLFVVAVGTVPSATLSVVALGFAYVRGFRRRHIAPQPSG